MTKDYIEGIIVFYKGAELALMSDRAVDYHTEKAASYKKLAVEVDKLRKGEIVILSPESATYAKLTMYHADPVMQAEKDAASHERRKRLHEHLREHYDKDATYGLEVIDLELYGLSRV